MAMGTLLCVLVSLGSRHVRAAMPLSVARCCSSHPCSPRAVYVYYCLPWDDSFGRVAFENIEPRLLLSGGGFLSVAPNISRTVTAAA